MSEWWVVGGVLGTFAVVVGLGFWYFRTPEYEFDNGRDLPTNVTGTWDWSTRETPCADSAHVISFSNDARVMTITQQRPMLDSLGRDWTVTTYDVLDIGPSRIRGAIRGETRLTDDGVPVVWDLVVVGADEYRWHRTDWGSLLFTPGIVRCRP